MKTFNAFGIINNQINNDNIYVLQITVASFIF